MSSQLESSIKLLTKILSNPELIKKNLASLDEKIKAARLSSEQAKLDVAAAKDRQVEIDELQGQLDKAKTSFAAQQKAFEVDRANHAATKAAFAEAHTAFLLEQQKHATNVEGLKDMASQLENQRVAHYDKVARTEASLEERTDALNKYEKQLNTFEKGLDDRDAQIKRDEAELKKKANKLGIVAALFPDK